MEIGDAADWKYKAEGNRNIVVCNGKGKCLRLLKFSPQNHSAFLTIKEQQNGLPDSTCSQLDSSASSDNRTDDLKFLECIVLPLINYCDACHLPKVIKVSNIFLRKLDYQINKDRPMHRKHKSLHYNVPGLLMQDHCFIPYTKCWETLLHSNAVLNPNIVTVEIKPKRGFIKSLQSSPNNAASLPLPVCQFCQTQIYRVLCEKRYKKCSFYCPMDLFSNDESRMKRALLALLFAPQNNFRMFKNGNLVFSQEILDALFLDNTNSDIIKITNTYLKALLCPIMQSNVNNTNEIDTIVDLLFQALLVPVVKEASNTLTHSEYCNGAHYKENLCKQKSFRPVKRVEQTTSLPATCILNLILQQQKLDKFSVPEIFGQFQELKSCLESNPKSKDILSIDAPYTSSGWSRLTSSLKDDKDTAEKEGILSDAAHQLRQFLVAKSFSDCSVMITFQKINIISSNDIRAIKNMIKSKPSTALFNIIQDSEGGFYIASIAMVDTDPKPSNRIPEYYKKYNEISKWWKKAIDT